MLLTCAWQTLALDCHLLEAAVLRGRYLTYHDEVV